MVAACGGAVLFSTPAVIGLGYRFNWVDRPDARKQHQTVMVRVGGLAIMLGMLAAFVGLTQCSGLGIDAAHWAIIGGSLAAFGLGFADDLFSLSPGLRLLLQAVITLCVWSAGVQIEAVPVPGLGWVALGGLSLPVTFLWLAGVTNAINWLDGLDGLAAGIGSISSLMIAATCSHLGHDVEAILALCLAVSLLGFLCYNARPAKLFMGDGGAYLIGFMLASLSITGLMQDGSAVTAALPCLILGIPIADMVYVILGRLMAQKSPFFPDRRHLHHRLLSSGYGYDRTVWLIYGWVAFSGFCAAAASGIHGAVNVLAGLLIVLIVAHQIPAGLTLQSVLSVLRTQPQKTASTPGQ